MKIDWDRIPSTALPSDAIAMLVKMVDESFQKNDPVFLSDVLIRRDGIGGPVLEMLAQKEAQAKNSTNIKELKWHIEVIRDEWGNIPQPGETIYHVKKINRYRNPGNRPVLADAYNVAKVMGDYEEKYTQKDPYIVDEKGCIKCSFTPAVYFLNGWGIHGETNQPVMYHIKPEQSIEPVDAPNGQKLHVWYRRYREVTPEKYATMKNRKNSNQEKRGV